VNNDYFTNQCKPFLFFHKNPIKTTAVFRDRKEDHPGLSLMFNNLKPGYG
jgi:hypothetical protein